MQEIHIHIFKTLQIAQNSTEILRKSSLTSNNENNIIYKFINYNFLINFLSFLYFFNCLCTYISFSNKIYVSTTSRESEKSNEKKASRIVYGREGERSKRREGREK